MKNRADEVGLELLHGLVSNPDLDISSETRKITLVEISEDERVEIEWFGNDHKWEITRVGLRVGYQDLQSSEELSVAPGHPLWTYAGFIIQVIG